MFAAAVTGTNGKTSTVEFTRQLLAGAGVAAVSVSSRGTTHAGRTRPTAFLPSRPGCWADAVAELGDRYEAAALEAYSAALGAGEWDGVELDAAALTTFDHDHLDWHGSLEGYAGAKLRLFERGVGRGGTIVARTDTALWDDVRRIGRDRRCRVVGCGPGGAVRIRRWIRDAPEDPSAAAGGVAPPSGLAAEVEAFGAVETVRVPVGARFLVENATVAVALAVVGGAPARAALRFLEDLEAPPGRMQRVDGGGGRTAFVDFAHTPGALEAALREMRRAAEGRVVLVLGSGGGRDRTRRPAMGRVAARLADRVFVTDDNPRSEDPARIRAELLDACPFAVEVPSRPRAIRAAAGILQPGDALLVCGRGDETVQDYGDRIVSCRDVDAVRSALKAL